ncbi:MAG: hypothetical protein E6J88_00705 [Deltaproteobacteria bacterium]|nr:MAG: hypothetical protein E6J88_00705 [Deltaproteobacteria bacterium]
MAMISAALSALLAAQPLSASVPPAVRADGRTTAPVVLSFGVEPEEGEKFADQGAIACAGAPTIPAEHGKPARVLVPASVSAGQLSCKARRRGEDTNFSLHFQPPGPGLYATLAKAFRIGAGGVVRAPASLRAAVSAGTIAAGEGGTLRAALPPGRSPRALAVALIDAEGEGAAFLPLSGRTQLHLESKKRALLSVRVAGTVFGPVRAPQGKATLPVEVPPGVREGVVRAVDRLGNVREVLVDLQTPDLPRIAAVLSAAQVVAGEELRLAVAVAAADGSPAESPAPRASARSGTVAKLSQNGPGFWTARYRAAAPPGRDLVTIEDPLAGRVELAIEVIAGPPAEISLAPSNPARAGEELILHAGVRDAAGNSLSSVPLEASLAGERARVSWDGTLAAVAARIPERLPAEPALELSVRAGPSARATSRIEVLPGEAASAELRAEPDQRQGRVRALVRDRFGNPLGTSGFTVAAQGADVGALRRSAGGAAEATLDAAPRAREADATIVAGGRVLARAHVVFDPPPADWLVVARARGGAMTNGGAVTAPRLGADIGVRRWFGSIEGAVLLGLDALWYRGDIITQVGGVDRPISERLSAFSLPLLIRARLPFARRFAAAVELGPVATLAWSAASSDVSGTERLTNLVGGFRAGASIDYVLGRGRIALGATLGRTRLTDGPLRGEIEGRSLFVGYEAWLADLSP